MVPEITTLTVTAVGTGTTGMNGKSRSAASTEPKSGASANGGIRPDINMSGGSGSDGKIDIIGITRPLRPSISGTTVNRPSLPWEAPRFHQGGDLLSLSRDQGHRSLLFLSRHAEVCAYRINYTEQKRDGSASGGHPETISQHCKSDRPDNILHQH